MMEREDALMKKLLSLFLTLLLVLPASVPAAAAGERITPTPPDWCPEEEYAVFDGSAAYEKENWEKILLLRETVSEQICYYHTLPEKAKQAYNELFDLAYESPHDPGIIFELGLVELKFWQEEDGKLVSSGSAIGNAKSDAETDQQRYACLLWETRSKLMSRNWPLANRGTFSELLDELTTFPQFSWETLLDSTVIDDQRLQEAREMVYITLDGTFVAPGSVTLYTDLKNPTTELHTAQIRDNRTMVPVRFLAECLGADVTWDEKTQQVTLCRAGDTIVMTLGERLAYRNGSAFEMDTAPYADQGRTYIPLRYMAEFFGQKVEWLPDQRRVVISEDKEAVAPSNLEAWALPMGAMLVKMNRDEPTWFGMLPRTEETTLSGDWRDETHCYPCDRYRGALSRGWGVQSREDLILTVCNMTYGGHNASFQEAAAIANSLTDNEMESPIAQSDEVDAYMWPYTKALSEKWGDRGILCWDLFRMSDLVQWGYTAGYVTYTEALALLEPAATLLCESFSSWDEAYENYLDGYNWWARNNVLGQNVWETERGETYVQMRESEETSYLFDDALFSEGVIPVHGITAQQLLDEAREKNA